MKILLYEPDQRTGEPIYHALRREGHDVIWIQEYMDARTKILDEKFDASLIEIDDYEGLRLIESWVEQSPKLLCVAIYKEQDAGVGFKASKLGSQEIYEIEHGSISELDRILKQYKILARLPQVYRHKSVEYNKAVSDLRNLVNHHKPVIITGEVGTGKSYLAEHVHRDDSDTVFRLEEIQCSTLNVENAMELFLGVVRGFRPEIKQHRKGLIDKSNEKGLLYLKDIADLPANLQEVLLDILERGEYRRVGSEIWEPFTAHLIVSCKDISEIRTDRFDRRLYDLLSHNIVRIPPLRECPADIVSNAEQMAEDYCRSKGIVAMPVFNADAMIKLMSHDWLGNYRELKSCVENAVVCCAGDTITASDLHITPVESDTLPEDDKGKLIFYLDKFCGKKVDVMKALGITAPTLDKRLKKYGIDYKLFKKKKERKPRKKTTASK